MKASQILAEIKAVEELTARGYVRVKCKLCEGAGFLMYSPLNRVPCSDCEGSGLQWTPPQTR
jgi:hypothetical protein